MDQTFMKKKPILQLVLTMSLPMVISMLVNSLYNIVDSFFVAQISENAMTALSFVFPIQNLVNAVIIGFAIGINATIAFYLGAQDNQNADVAATQGILFNVIHGILLTVICIAIMPGFLGLFTSDADVINLGIKYSNIVFSFSIIIALGISFEKIFQSVGRMAVSMVSMLSGCIVNIILDPILIFGLGPAPQMGIEGAALATGIGQIVTVIIYISIYIIKPIPVKIRRNSFIYQKEMAMKLYSIGIPAALNLALPSLLVSSLNAILTGYSQIYVVVLGVYYKLQTFLYLPANGIVQGMRSLIGYNYGAKEYKRVKQIYITSLLLTVVIMVFGTFLCLIIPEQLIGLFTTNNETVQAGAFALRIISIGFIISSISVVSSGALEGLGMGIPSFVISFCRYVLIILPFAFLFSSLIGAIGIWHAFWITEFLTAAASYFIYRNAMSRK